MFYRNVSFPLYIMVDSAYNNNNKITGTVEER